MEPVESTPYNIDMLAILLARTSGLLVAPPVVTVQTNCDEPLIEKLFIKVVLVDVAAVPPWQLIMPSRLTPPD